MSSFFNFMEFYIYLLQQKVYLFLSIESHSIEPLIIVIFFLSGCLTSFNPCLISMLPVSISYISTQSKKDLNNISFILGFANSLLFIFFLTSLFKESFQFLIISIPIFSSFFIIILSLNLLQIIQFKVSLFNFNIKQISLLEIKPFMEAYILGLVLGLSSSSCSTPILLTLLSWLFSKSSFIQALIYLYFYIFGNILPLSLFINLTLYSNQVKIIAQLWQYFIPFGGSILLGLGIFSFLEHIFI